jgi:hypothetical protein
MTEARACFQDGVDATGTGWKVDQYNFASLAGFWLWQDWIVELKKRAWAKKFKKVLYLQVLYKFIIIYVEKHEIKTLTSSDFSDLSSLLDCEKIFQGEF